LGFEKFPAQSGQFPVVPFGVDGMTKFGGFEHDNSPFMGKGSIR
jgi:hypothetical protein